MLWLPQAIKQLWLPGFFLALFITVQSGAFSGELSTAASVLPQIDCRQMHALVQGTVPAVE